MSGAATDAAQELQDRLRHPDPSQLWFQLREIVVERSYLRHGVQLPPGSVVFDAGANVGVAAAFFAHVCGAGAVHAFEPVRPIFEVLQANLGQFPGCAAHPFGLSDSRRSQAITYYPGAAAMSGLYADPAVDREVPRRAMSGAGMTSGDIDDELAQRFVPQELVCELRTVSDVIDELALERIDLLKVDVEGAELDLLSGVQDRDWPRISQVAMEIHDPVSVEAVKDELGKRGFQVIVEQDPAFEPAGISMAYATRPDHAPQ